MIIIRDTGEFAFLRASHIARASVEDKSRTFEMSIGQRKRRNRKKVRKQDKGEMSTSPPLLNYLTDAFKFPNGVPNPGNFSASIFRRKSEAEMMATHLYAVCGYC